MKRLKILYLTHHWMSNSHHASHSGYQRLIFEASKHHDCTVVTWGDKTGIYIENGITVHYTKPLLKSEIFFSKRLAISRYAKKIQQKFDVVHALYSDCGFFQKHHNFISTFHVSAYLERSGGILSFLFLFLKNFIIEDRTFFFSKKIIVVSKNLIPALGKYADKSVFIPHGIDTDFWNPKVFSHEIPSNDFVLSVGNNGVDKEALSMAIIKNPDIKFIVVGLRDFQLNTDNLTCLSKISDEELQKLYYNCRLFIRPMRFATANNSVLEAMSMNKAIFISTMNGEYDYFDEKIDDLHIVKTFDFVNILPQLYIRYGSYLDNNEIREYTINKLSWSNIFKNTENLYR